jgi:DNA-binding NtrC family response regulator
MSNRTTGRGKEQEPADSGRRPVILIVDDHYRAFQSLPGLISPEKFSSRWAGDEYEGLKILRDLGTRVEIVIVDLKSSGMGGGGFLQQARQIAPHAAVLITGPLGPFLYRRGNFYDFSGPGLKRDINAILLDILQRSEFHDGSIHKRKEGFGVIVGRSASINEVYTLIENLKESSATVLIQGESGTGKELVARTIHETSRRKDRPFLAINCGAIPPNLMESELFGHEKGAFTTAVQQRKGKFEAAHEGTLFLDEISELDRGLQVKLLRVLQEQEYQRVGGNRTYKADVRIIAAAGCDLRRLAASGGFRDDLFYRLNVVPVTIPSLRERREDIPLLLEDFFKGTAQEMKRPVPLLTERAREALLGYSYPGNVRELINLVQRLFVICPNGQITFGDLPEEVREEADPAPESFEILKELPREGIRLRDVEKELIIKTLARVGGNKAAAARILGITRRLLYLRLSEFGLTSTDITCCDSRKRML